LVLQDKHHHPKAYLVPCVPAIWKVTTIRDLPKSVMHLAMNLQRAILDLMFTFARTKSKGSHLLKRATPVLAMVMKLLFPVRL
jgi:hypothetical protein